MRHGSYQGRRNNRHRNRNSGPSRPHRNQVLDSNGPEGRVRGTAFQINEKYSGLAKDASGKGDQILSENYLQHAEHYQRMINEFEEQNPRPKRNPRNDDDSDQNDDDQSDDTETEAKDEAPKKRGRKKVEKSEDNEDDDLGLPETIVAAPEEKPKKTRKTTRVSAKKAVGE